MEEPFNPLDKLRLGEQIREALEKRPVIEMPPPKFNGAGIYAIYFNGAGKKGYEALSQVNNDKAGWQLPVYVGKAVPKGARKGLATMDATKGIAMWDRIKQHSKSLTEAGFDLRDFRVRYLMVDDIWIPLGEMLTIVKFHPVWNLVLDGFGNKVPGKNRHQLPTWDIMHEGRPWAAAAKKEFLKKGDWKSEDFTRVGNELLEKIRIQIGKSIKDLRNPTPKQVSAAEIEETLQSLASDGETPSEHDEP